MTLQLRNIKVNGKVVRVGFRLVHTPHRGFIVEYLGSTALMEIRKASVVLRSAYGVWDVDLLKVIKDHIKPK